MYLRYLEVRRREKTKMVTQFYQKLSEGERDKKFLSQLNSNFFLTNALLGIELKKLKEISDELKLQMARQMLDDEENVVKGSLTRKANLEKILNQSQEEGDALIEKGSKVSEGSNLGKKINSEAKIEKKNDFLNFSLAGLILDLDLIGIDQKSQEESPSNEDGFEHCTILNKKEDDNETGETNKISSNNTNRVHRNQRKLDNLVLSQPLDLSIPLLGHRSQDEDDGEEEKGEESEDEVNEEPEEDEQDEEHEEPEILCRLCRRPLIDSEETTRVSMHRHHATSSNLARLLNDDELILLPCCRSFVHPLCARVAFSFSPTCDCMMNVRLAMIGYLLRKNFGLEALPAKGPECFLSSNMTHFFVNFCR